MAAPPPPMDPFLQIVFDLRMLDNEALLAAWKANTARFARVVGDGPASLARRDELRLRHNAFRAVAVKRFGEVAQVERQHGLALSAA